VASIWCSTQQSPWVDRKCQVYNPCVLAGDKEREAQQSAPFFNSWVGRKRNCKLPEYHNQYCIHV